MSTEIETPAPRTFPERVREGLENWLEQAKTRKHVFDLVVAILIGLLCGYSAVGFRLLIGYLAQVFWGSDQMSLELLAAAERWRVVLIPALGGLLAGPVVYFYVREAKGHGVPEVMAAVALKNGIIRFRVALTKAVTSALTIASGGSVGREGPVIQIGAALGSSVGQVLKVSGSRMRTYVGCGAAGGIAATFNAPIAGALFSVEVILREFGVGQFSPIVISSVIATVISRHYLGDHPVFEVPPYNLTHAMELGPYLALGLLCAVVSVAFTKTLYATEDLFDERLTKVPGWLRPALGGLLLGGIGLFVPHVFGDGQEAINLTLLSEISGGLLVILLVAKIAATSLTLGSGGSGGVFAPSLFLGAVTGALVGQLSCRIFGFDPSLAGGYALVGMGGVVAGTTHAPITAMLIIFEITNNYTIILPLMTVCIISTLLSSRLNNESIYTTKLVRRGLDIFRNRPVDVLKGHPIKDAVRKDYDHVTTGATAREVIEKVISGDHSYCYIVEEDGTFKGAASIEDVRRILINREQLEHVLLAEDLAHEETEVCYEDETLSQALHKFERTGLSELPVLGRGTERRMAGVIHYHDVLAKYNAEILRLDTPETMASQVRFSSGMTKVKIVDGYSMVDWEPPSPFWHRSLREAALGSRYRVHVALVKRPPAENGLPHAPIVPTGDYQIQPGDILVIYGGDADIEKTLQL